MPWSRRPTWRSRPTWPQTSSEAVANPDQAGKLVAYTHLTWAGDATLIVPEQPDQLSELLATLHDKTVEQARASKVATLEAVVKAAGSLLEALKIV